MPLVRIDTPAGGVWAVERGDALLALDRPLAELLALSSDAARAVVEAASDPVDLDGPPALLAPVDEQEVWASGVTYERSRDGRMAEAANASPYELVYDAERPELFFKSAPWRVVADGEDIAVRSDSPWNVPEPELALFVHSDGGIFGYGVANDVSSRSIEGENPLYLPQAKVYDRSCALGRRIVPAWETEGPWEIRLVIRGADGVTRFEGTTSTTSLHRDLDDVARYLVSALSFPAGAVLLTGTGIVPGDEFTLLPGDEVAIEIDGIGTLTNPVTTLEVRP